jgi:hypothetical protein
MYSKYAEEYAEQQRRQTRPIGDIGPALNAARSAALRAGPRALVHEVATLGAVEHFASRELGSTFALHTEPPTDDYVNRSADSQLPAAAAILHHAFRAFRAGSRLLQKTVPQSRKVRFAPASFALCLYGALA